MGLGLVYTRFEFRVLDSGRGRKPYIPKATPTTSTPNPKPTINPKPQTDREPETLSLRNTRSRETGDIGSRILCSVEPNVLSFFKRNIIRIRTELSYSEPEGGFMNQGSAETDRKHTDLIVD